MSQLRCIGVLAHPQRPQTFPLAHTIAHSLRERGLDHWLYTTWDEKDVTRLMTQTDMVVAIGGDGAMLKAGRVCAPYQVPVLGINTGRLGFLTEIHRAEKWPQAIERVLRGDYWIEKRMMLTASILRQERPLIHSEALNDIVVSGSVVGRMIQLDLYIDGQWATTYNADALIVATATGSTAYALAAGGPILPPDLANILILPAAPHLSMERPIVLSEGSRVDIRPTADNRGDVVVAADGAVIWQLGKNESVQAQSSQHSARFVRLRERTYFYRSLLDRMEPRITRREPDSGNDV